MKPKRPWWVILRWLVEDGERGRDVRQPPCEGELIAELGVNVGNGLLEGGGIDDARIVNVVYTHALSIDQPPPPVKEKVVEMS